MQARGTWTLLLDRIAEDSSEVGVEVLLGCVCVCSHFWLMFQALGDEALVCDSSPVTLPTAPRTCGKTHLCPLLEIRP